MTTKVTIFLSILVFCVTTGYGQIYEPLELARMIFGKDSLINIDKFINGEYKGRPNGKDLQKGSATKFTLLGQVNNRSVVAMTILDATGKGLDTYLHFKKDSIWKMIAFRGLALTGIMEQVKNGLEKMTPQEVDDMISKSKKKKKRDNFTIFTSRADYDFQLGNATLILELDDNIARHFVINQAEFERLKNLALIQLEKGKVNEEKSTMLIENLKEDFQKLFISAVSAGGYELGNGINFLIGGMVDNTVGYIYVQDKKDLPEMNPDRVIMIREIGNGWFIYKTT